MNYESGNYLKESVPLPITCRLCLNRNCILNFDMSNMLCIYQVFSAFPWWLSNEDIDLNELSGGLISQYTSFKKNSNVGFANVPQYCRYRESVNKSIISPGQRKR